MALVLTGGDSGIGRVCSWPSPRSNGGVGRRMYARSPHRVPPRLVRPCGSILSAAA